MVRLTVQFEPAAEVERRSGRAQLAAAVAPAGQLRIRGAEAFGPFGLAAVADGAALTLAVRAAAAVLSRRAHQRHPQAGPDPARGGWVSGPEGGLRALQAALATSSLRELRLARVQALRGAALGAALSEAVLAQLGSTLVVLSVLDCGCDEGAPPAGLRCLEALRTLILPRAGLRGPFPTLHARAGRQLRVLDLSGNRLCGPLPRWLPDASHLRRCALSGNELEGAVPPLSARGLEQLELQANRLAGPLPESLTECAALEVLRVGTSALTGGIPSSYGGLHLLRVLDLGGSGIGGPIPTELRGCSALEALTLPRCGLSGPIPAELGHLRRLRALRLDGNALSGAVPRQLGRCTALALLHLHNNRLTAAEAVLPLEHLTELTLHGNPIPAGGLPAGLGRMPRLTALTVPSEHHAAAMPLHSGLQLQAKRDLL